MSDCAGTGEASVSASGDKAAPCKEAAKKKRNLPGMPGKLINFAVNTITMILAFNLVRG